LFDDNLRLGVLSVYLKHSGFKELTGLRDMKGIWSERSPSAHRGGTGIIS